MKNYFYKTGLDVTKAKQCFDFLAKHSTYHTMNSWNGCRSIANDVKIYKLGLEGDAWNALALLESEDYLAVNEMIRDWEAEHEGYAVGFNGRSGGWLVLYNKGNYLSVLPDELTGDYEDFKEYCKEHYGSVEGYMGTLREYVRLVQDFDRLCDEIREYVDELSKLDPVEVIAGEKLDAFNDEYGDEMKEFGLPELELAEGARIIISDAAMKHKSLIRCLLDILRNDSYEARLEGNVVYLEAR